MFSFMDDIKKEREKKGMARNPMKYQVITYPIKA
jgi:hypothetical protein